MLTFQNGYHGYKKKSYVYDLYGVCYHSGGVLGGHYVSYVLKMRMVNGIVFNDTDVKEIPVNHK